MAQEELKNNYILGMDIGSTKVCAIVACEVETAGIKTIEIRGVSKVDCDGVSKGNVSNLYQTSRAITKALDQAAQQADFKYDEQESIWVNVNVGGTETDVQNERGTLSRRSSGEHVIQKDIEDLFRSVERGAASDSHEILHLIPGDFVVDNRTITEPLGEISRKLSSNFKVISVRTNALRNVNSALTNAYKGLKQDHKVYSPLASVLSLLDDEQKDEGVVLVDIGGGTTDVAVYAEGVLRHVAILPFSGSHITNDIKMAFGVSTKIAEAAKIMTETVIPTDLPITHVLRTPSTDSVRTTEILTRNVAIVMQARLREIAAMVSQEIQKTSYKNNIKNIVLTGGTSNVKGIDKLFAEVTGLNAIVGKPKGIRAVGQLHNEVQRDGSYATALGLIWAELKPIDKRALNIEELSDSEEAVEQVEKPKKNIFNTKKIGAFFKGFIKDELKNTDDEF
jgi:cell division protein FtsA